MWCGGAGRTRVGRASTAVPLSASRVIARALWCFDTFFRRFMASHGRRLICMTIIPARRSSACSFPLPSASAAFVRAPRWPPQSPSLESLVIGAPAAYAAPGDSGDLSVSSAGWHSRGEDGVEVCAFNLVATNFESYPSVPWTITAQPPTTPPGDTLASTLPARERRGAQREIPPPGGDVPAGVDRPGGPEAEGLQGRLRPARRQQPTRGDRPGCERCDRENGGNGESGEKGGEYRKPSGAVPAGGGGVPDMENLGTENESSIATPAALTVGAAGVAALVMVRRSARRRARNEA